MRNFSKPLKSRVLLNLSHCFFRVYDMKSIEAIPDAPPPLSKPVVFVRQESFMCEKSFGRKRNSTKNTTDSQRQASDIRGEETLSSPHVIPGMIFTAPFVFHPQCNRLRHLFFYWKREAESKVLSYIRRRRHCSNLTFLSLLAEKEAEKNIPSSGEWSTASSSTCLPET